MTVLDLLIIMAAVIGKCFKSSQYFLNLGRLDKKVLKVSIRNSRYGPKYVYPIADAQKLRELEEDGKIKEIAYVPIKAARNDLTSSVFHDELLSKFTNMVLRRGDRITARRLMEETFAKIKRTQLAKYNSAPEEKRAKIECNPYKILHQAVENCKPIAELQPIKRGGATYQVPVPIIPRRSTFLSIKWLILAGKEKEKKVFFPEQLAIELLDASKNQGKVVKKKQDLHVQCEANKAYAHFRW